MKDRTELRESVIEGFIKLTGKLRELVSQMRCKDKATALAGIQELQQARQQDIDDISAAINERLGTRAIKEISEIVGIQAFKLAALQTIQEWLLEHTKKNGTRTQSVNFSIVDTWSLICACEALLEEMFDGLPGMTADEILMAIAVIEFEQSQLFEAFAGNFSKLGKISQIAGILDALAGHSAAKRFESFTVALDNAVTES